MANSERKKALRIERRILLVRKVPDEFTKAMMWLVITHYMVINHKLEGSEADLQVKSLT